MKLIPESLLRKLPPLYATDYIEHTLLQAKVFARWSDWTWYIAEFDGKDTCFGLVQREWGRWGRFRISELEAIRGPGGLTLERDSEFRPTTLDQMVRY